jgi:hypothetical protein
MGGVIQRIRRVKGKLDTEQDVASQSSANYVSGRCRRLNSVCLSAFFHATSNTISTRTPVGTTSDKLALLQTALEVEPFDGDPKGNPNGEDSGVKCECN